MNVGVYQNTMKCFAYDKDIIPSIAHQLEQGHVVAMATETVYGLAALANQPGAIQKIFEIKKRPMTNPLIVHLPCGQISLPSLHDRGIINEDLLTPFQKNTYERIVSHWPSGPLSILLPKGPAISLMITAQSPWVAIRRPENCAMADILNSQLLSAPIVAPSANPYQRISPIDAQMIQDYYPDEIEGAFLLDSGRVQFGLESTIICLLDREMSIQIMREGHITKELLEFRAGLNVEQTHETTKDIVTSGMDLVHYAPIHETFRVPYSTFFHLPTLQKLLENKCNRQKKILCFDISDECLVYVKKLGVPTIQLGINPKLAAYEFYRSLFLLDQQDSLESIDEMTIFISSCPQLGHEFKAIEDKIIRASTKV